MRRRSTGWRWLWGLIATVASACSRTGLDVGGDDSGGAEQDGAVLVGLSDSDDGLQGETDSAQPEPTNPLPDSAVVEEGGCSMSILMYEPPDTAFGACWTCAKQACLSQLTACAADCECNGIIASALTCTDDGKGVESCFLAAFDSAGDSAESTAAQCLMLGYGACNCAAVTPSSARDAAPATEQDASMACTSGGGGGGFGGSGCETTWDETCGGTQYDVVCSCPEGSCVCFGSTTHVVNYPGCPYCPNIPSLGATTVAAVFALCGFPPYPD
jgi:hypothetical protein